MEVIRLIPSLLDILAGPNGQAYVFTILYVGMGFYIYKMTTQINILKCNMKEYSAHTDEQFSKIATELKQINKVLYKMAGKLEIE